jgi:hypothetical protein
MKRCLTIQTRILIFFSNFPHRKKDRREKVNHPFSLVLAFVPCIYRWQQGNFSFDDVICVKCGNKNQHMLIHSFLSVLLTNVWVHDLHKGIENKHHKMVKFSSSNQFIGKFDRKTKYSLHSHLEISPSHH